MNKPILFTLTLSLFAVLNLLAQVDGNVYQLKVDGMNNGTVHSIFQDQEGIMWFGTDNGLSRFNGYDFETYQHRPEDTTSISSNIVVKILEKSERELWVATKNGLNILHKNTGIFEQILSNRRFEESLSNEVINDVVIQGDALWIGTAFGLNRIAASAPHQNVEHYYNISDSEPRLTGNRVNCLSMIDSSLWIGTEHGLAILDTETNSFRKLSDALHVSNLTNNLINDITQDASGSIWIATEMGLNRYFPRYDSLAKYLPAEIDSAEKQAKIIIEVFEDSNDNLWLCTDGAGVIKYNRITNTFTPYRKNLYSPNCLTTNTIYTMTESAEGILWLGTYEDQVYYFDQRKAEFNNFTHDPFKNSLNEGAVTSMVKSGFQDGIWVGTSNGITYFDIHSQTFVSHRFNEKMASSNIIRSMTEDESGKLWVGTYSGGLNHYDPGTRSNFAYPEIPTESAMSSPHIWSLFYESPDSLWVGTLRGGLVLFNPQTGEHEQYTYNPLLPNSISSNNISTIFKDSKGNLWVGSEEESGGLNLYNGKTGSFRQFTHDPKDSTSISHNLIRAIFEDKSGRLWIGTNQGLNRYDYETETFSNFNHLGSPFEGFISNILQDNDGFLWVSTNNGLIKFSPDSDEFYLYDQSKCLLSNQFIPGAALKLKDGRLIFGNRDGMNLFSPSNIPTNEPIPNLNLTEFKLNEDVIEPTSSDLIDEKINYIEAMTLESSQSSFSIGFAAINYYAPDKIEYAFRLNGLENDWRYVGNERRAAYTNLDPGYYTFEVKASNSFGDWSDETTKLNITILPAWYESLLFRVLLGAMIIAAIFLVVYYRTKTLARKKHQLQEMVNERTREIESLNKELARSNQSLIHTNNRLVSQTDELKSVISELNIARDRLVVSEKMASIGVFTAGIAHEINNPINYVSGAAELLCEIIDKHIKSENSDLESDEYATIKNLEQNIKSGLQKTVNIIKSLKNYVHEDTTSFRPFNLTYSIDDALQILNAEYKGRITIHRNYPEELIIECLPGKINQIIINLLRNAIDAIEDEGEIFINVKTRRGHVILRIRDTGQGIPPSMLAKLYDPFFTTKDVGKGMGLGLYIVYGLLDVHSGTISVESEPDVGTEFTVELPIKQESELPNQRITRNLKLS